jgi:UPF0755 protein
MQSALIKSLIGLIVLVSLVFLGYTGYDSLYGVSTTSPKGEYSLMVDSGQNIDNISQQLAGDKVIKNSYSLPILAKINELKPLQVGSYSLDLPAKPTEILNQLNNESDRISKENKEANKKPSVSVTIKEGWSLDRTIKELVTKNIASEEELVSYAQNTEIFATGSYEFLPKPLTCQYGEIENCAKYYLEGYLYPDTYSFFVPSTPEEVFEKMLDNFNTKVWQKVKTNPKDFNNQIILASVIERESGRTKGITAKTAPEVTIERANIASSLYNRLEQDIPWQSNVTVNYGTGLNLCEQTIDLENCRYLDDPLFKTSYNTYQNSGYPIAPITSPSIDSITAALNPNQTDFLYFVADNTGKTYFANTGQGHEENIVKVQEINAEL